MNDKKTDPAVFTHPKIRNHFLKMWTNYYGKEIKDVLSVLAIDANIDDFNQKKPGDFLKNLSLNDSLIILKDLFENGDVQADRYTNWNYYGDYLREWYPTLINYLKDIGVEYDEENTTFHVYEDKVELVYSIKSLPVSRDIKIVDEDVEPENSGKNELTNLNLNDTIKEKNEIFIVHGHDDGMRERVARVIEKLDLKPIILHEKPNKGNTIIEKFQSNSENIACSIILLSPDDIGCKAPLSPESAKHRARQNVILELGYFIGSLGREKVFALVKDHKNLEFPSDIFGVIYIPYEKGWELELAKEMKECGIDVDMNKLI